MKKANPNYDHYEFTEFNAQQIKKLKKGLEKRKIAIGGENNFILKNEYYLEEYCKSINNNLIENKEKAKKMIEEIILWLNNKDINVITVLGI